MTSILIPINQLTFSSFVIKPSTCSISEKCVEQGLVQRDVEQMLDTSRPIFFIVLSPTKAISELLFQKKTFKINWIDRIKELILIQNLSKINHNRKLSMALHWNFLAQKCNFIKASFRICTGSIRSSKVFLMWNRIFFLLRCSSQRKNYPIQTY